MKNLRKLLAVVVMVAVMLTYAIPAFAAVPSDVEGTEYESAVTRLVALGIITGRPDGTFAPNDTINRAEFAAVVIRALGYGTAADAAKAQTKFSDVAANHWAAGYINLASSLGIIKGRPDGTFGPNDAVLYEEAVTMVVRALGYEPAAAANGGYPTGYLTIASQEDIDDDAVLAVGVPAPRGIVAKLVDNSLEVTLMEQVSYGTETSFQKTNPAKTLLEDKLKLNKREDVEVLSVDGQEIKVKLSDSTKKTYDVFETISTVGLANAIVTLWEKSGVVYNISVDSTTYYDFISEINGIDDVADFTGEDCDEITEITLLNADTTFDTLDDDNDDLADITVIDNKVSQTIATYDAVNLLDAFVKIVVNDSKIVRIEAYDVDDGSGLITEVTDEQIEYTRGTVEGRKIRDLDDADSILVVIDGEIATLADLEADMYMDHFSNGSDYVFVASTEKIEGVLDRAKSAEIQIDGTYTDLAGTFYVSTDAGDGYTAGGAFDDLIGEEIIAYVNNQGDIVYVKGDVEETTSTFYGVVVDKNDFNNNLKVRKDVDGTTKNVTFETDLRSTTSGTDLAYSSVNKAGATAASRLAAFYKFTIDSDNVITKVEDVNTAADNIANCVFDEDADAIKNAAGTTRIYLDDDTPVFEISAADSDITIYKWADIKGTNVAAADGVTAYYSDDDFTPAFVVLDDTGAQVTFENDDYYFGLVTDRERISADDYEYDLTTNDGAVTLTIDEDDAVVNGVNAVEDHFIAYRLTSDSTAEIVAISTYDDLSDVGAMNADWDVVSNVTVGRDSISVDDQTFSDGTTTYELADDALVYEVSGDDMDDFDDADIGDVDDEGANASDRSSISFILYKGKVKFLFFWN